MFRTIALTGIAALMAATTIPLAPPAHAQIGNIFSDPPPRPPGGIRGQSAAAAVRRRRGSAGAAARPAAADAQSPAAGAGRAAAGVGAVAAAGAAARHHHHSAKQPAQHCRRAAWRRAAAGLAAGTAPAQGRAGRERAADAGQPAARRRGGHRAAGAEDRQQESELFRARQDHRAHHQFRRGYRRNRPVRRAAGQDRACYTRPATEAANTDAFVEVDEITLQGEVKRIFSGWMYRGEPRPARRRASDLRYLADRLQRSGNHHRDGGARAAEARGAEAAAEARAAEAAGPAFGAAAAAAVRSAAAATTPAATATAARRPVRDFPVATGVAQPRAAMISSALAPLTGRSTGNRAKSAAAPLIALSSSAV